MSKFRLPKVSKNSNVSDVVQDLKTLHNALSEVQQDDFPMVQSELTPIACHLVKDILLKNEDKTIRLLTACCLSNILRLFAPDAPYDGEQLQDIFGLMIQQLKTLADEKNVYQNYVFYLLESLATIKSIVLLLDVDDSIGDRERLLMQLFNLLFDLSPLPHLTRPAKLYLLEVGQTLLDESERINSDLIRLLVQKCSDVRQDTRKFAGDLVKVCSDKLQPSFGLFFNEAIVSWSGDEGGSGVGKRLELLRQIHAHMAEVGKASPESISSVIVQLEDELHANSGDIRLLALNTVGNLFADSSVGGEFFRLYPQLWTSFLNKMNDRSNGLRIQWANLTLEILASTISNAEMKKALQQAFCEKLLDVDAKVREKICETVGKFIEEGRAPQILGADIIEEICNRCRDKVQEVRIPAMNVLCELIGRLARLDPGNILFTLCVNNLWKLIYTSDRDLRIFYEYFIEHSFMMKKADVALKEHSMLLVLTFCVMNDESRKAFKKWLNDKSLFVKYFSAFHRLALYNSEDPRLQPIILHISNMCRIPLEAQALLRALPTTLFKHETAGPSFSTFVNAETSLRRLGQAIEALSESNFTEIDSRLRPYMIAFIIRRASCYSIHGDLLNEILKIDEKDLLSSTRLLVEEIITEFPQMGVKHAGLLEELVLAPDNVDDCQEHLKAYSQFAFSCADKLEPSARFEQRLWDAYKNGSRLTCKYAFRVLMAFKERYHGPIKEDITNKLFGKDLMTASEWQILAEGAQISGFLEDEQINRVKELMSNLLLATSQTTKKTNTVLKLDQWPASDISFVLAVRCIRNFIVSLRLSNKTKEMEMLREYAPLFVNFLKDSQSPIVQIALAKTLLLFVPRPTVTTLITNLGPLLSLAREAPPSVQEKLASVIMRHYTLGNVGLIYLAVPLFSTPIFTKYLTSLSDLRKNDRHADSYLPLDDTLVEINSRNLRRYEDWIVICLVMATLVECSHVDVVGLVHSLVSLVATEMNISYLFDAVVQLKRYTFVSEFSSRNKQLYVASELAQASLRDRATSGKWQLQSLKTPVVVTDDLLTELSSVEEMGRNLSKSFLLRVESTNVSVNADKETPMVIDDVIIKEDMENVDNSSASMNSETSTPSKNGKAQIVRRSDRKRTIV